MAAIDTDLFRTMKIAIEAESSIKNLIATDVAGNPCIRPGKFTQTGTKYPELTIEIEEGESDASFPSTKNIAKIYVWVDPKLQNGNYLFLKGISDDLIVLFNREGSKYNNIDIVTDTGIRCCQFIKISRSFDKDEQLKLNYVEIIFEVIISESETFATDKAGDKTWV